MYDYDDFEINGREGVIVVVVVVMVMVVWCDGTW